ncbi:hypothetical protein GCM10018965_037130 [Nonomuraea roseola]
MHREMTRAPADAAALRASTSAWGTGRPDCTHAYGSAGTITVSASASASRPMARVLEEAELAPGARRFLRAEPEVVPRVGQVGPFRAEHLAGDRDLEQGHVVDQSQGDGTGGARPPAYGRNFANSGTPATRGPFHALASFRREHHRTQAVHLRPGQRDLLIDLFDREFVESQEALGMRVVGQFRDEDDPDRFVWLRSFPTMPGPARGADRVLRRGRSLEEARARRQRHDGGLLERPPAASRGPGLRFPEPETPRPPAGATSLPGSRVMATIYAVDEQADGDFSRFFDDRVAPLMAETGAPPLARLRTEHADNTFPPPARQRGGEPLHLVRLVRRRRSAS